MKKNGIDLQEGDLIFVKEGSYRVGDVAILLATDAKILLNSHCLVFRVINSQNRYEIDALYLAYLITHKLTQQQLYNKVLIDATLPNIGDHWKELQLPLHKHSEERNRIKKMMEEIIAGRKETEEKIHQLRQQTHY